MADYYFISQLPSLDGIGEQAHLPITEEYFSELCNRFLSSKTQEILKKITLSPPKSPKPSGSALVDAWNEAERALRLTLGKVRAEKMGKSFDTEGAGPSAEQKQAIHAAMDAVDPMEAERILTRCRLRTLESIRPVDNFSREYIFYYGLKLKLMQHARQFDKAAGEAAYNQITHSILNTRSEAMS